MVEAFAKKYNLTASSAGTLPSQVVNPVFVQAMNEKDIALSTSSPKLLTVEKIEEASLVVTMGCSVEKVCPRPMLAQMKKKLIDWDLEDPKGKSIEEVRRIRDEIERRVREIALDNVRS